MARTDLRFVRTWLLLVQILLAGGVTAQDSPRNATYRTDCQATPITLPGDPLNRDITVMELQVEDLDETGGRGVLALDESEVAFDDFGEGEVTRKGRTERFVVELQRIGVADSTSEGRRLFKLNFEGAKWSNRIYFVWSPGKFTASRLLVRGDGQTKVTQVGIDQLKCHLPECKVQR